jgi:hypothetical protein
MLFRLHFYDCIYFSFPFSPAPSPTFPGNFLGVLFQLFDASYALAIKPVAGSQFLGGHCRKNVTEAELPSSDD